VPNTPRTDDAIAEPAARPETIPGESLVLWVLWLTYGSFYFCRQNISAAVPGLQSELGYSKTEIGLVLGGLKVAYALGQLVNGQIAERIAARRLLALGMLGSAALNVVFGFATGLYLLLFIWACNGYCQALGWTPCVRVAANWFPVSRRGRAIGVLGTSYQAMAAGTYIVAGWSAERFGWRGALYLPAALLALSALHMIVFLRESPADVDVPTATPSNARTGGALDGLWLTLSNPALWLLAMSLALLDACRYGYQDWGITHLLEVQRADRTAEVLTLFCFSPGGLFPANIPWAGMAELQRPATGVGTAALKYAFLPLGGIVGALAGGWLTDRFFGGRRAPAIVGFLILLGLLSLGYEWAAHAETSITLTVLVLVGFAIFGAQVLLVGTAPADLARHGTAAAAAGFVNFMGYLGAFAGDQITGYVVQHFHWRAAILFWSGCAFVAAGICALLWNATAHESRTPSESETTA
jgi:sugar phosphate permease